VIVAVPADEHVAAVVLTAGVVGVVNCVAILKLELGDEVHELALVAVTV
jgi:hypothetical protein